MAEMYTNGDDPEKLYEDPDDKYEPPPPLKKTLGESFTP